MAFTPHRSARWLALVAAASLASCTQPAAPPPRDAGAAPVGQVGGQPARAFVIAANPLAAEAGMKVLRAGGSAVDAAVAVQATLSLVEPQSSGMGGGAFMTYYDGASRRVTVYDGRETAPAGATPDMLMGPDGKPLPFPVAVLSGRATGVPGAVKMLSLAQREHGALPWSALFATPQELARQGFAISPRLGRMLAADGVFPELSAPDVRAYFARPDGGLMRTGDIIRNPAYAEFLGRLAKQGPDALYTGATARRIVAKVHEGALASSMTLADLAAYRPVERQPVCASWQVYLLCAPPPPASGVGLIELLLLLEKTDIAARGPNDPQAWYLFAAASRLMYADRDRYVGDPAFVSVPVQGMIDPAYITQRARLIGPEAGPPPAAGTPAAAPRIAGRDATVEPMGTSHFIVGDAGGNVVSMTTTVESIFGSGRMVDGFFLNNQMTDFSFTPRDADGQPMANAVAAGKRPRSSMTPLVLLNAADRSFAGAFGSAGGNAILAYVGKSMVGAIDWKLSTQQALALPNLVARGAAFQGEVTRFPPEVLAGLAARGVVLKPGQGEDSGVHAVMMRDGVPDGGFDPRREGRVLVEVLPPPRMVARRVTGAAPAAARELVAAR